MGSLHALEDDERRLELVAERELREEEADDVVDEEEREEADEADEQMAGEQNGFHHGQFTGEQEEEDVVEKLEGTEDGVDEGPLLGAEDGVGGEGGEGTGGGGGVVGGVDDVQGSREEACEDELDAHWARPSGVAPHVPTGIKITGLNGSPDGTPCI